VGGMAAPLPTFDHGAFTDDSDRFVWNLTTSGFFTVKSMYKDLMNSHSRFPTRYLWKIKVLLK
jgi:hypothetical protein